MENLNLIPKIGISQKADPLENQRINRFKKFILKNPESERRIGIQKADNEAKENSKRIRINERKKILEDSILKSPKPQF